MTDLALDIKGLCKTFSTLFSRHRVEAVKNIGFSVKRGEVFGLLGPNGSGKTTTIKMILGLLFPTAGQIAVLGRNPVDTAVKRQIGFLAEESYAYTFLNADQTLDFYGKLFGLNAGERRSRAENLIRRVGLQHARSRKLREYSKGMSRRIGLAVALLNDPDLLILDEPTSGMDPIGTREVKDLILELKRNGKTLLVCSHLLADVEEVCDRVAIMHKGEIKVQGGIAELLAVKEVLQIDIRQYPPQELAALRNAILQRGGDIMRMGPARQTLEELFLHTIEQHKNQEPAPPQP